MIPAGDGLLHWYSSKYLRIALSFLWSNRSSFDSQDYFGIHRRFGESDYLQSLYKRPCSNIIKAGSDVFFSYTYESTSYINIVKVTRYYSYLWMGKNSETCDPVNFLQLQRRLSLLEFISLLSEQQEKCGSYSYHHLRIDTERPRQLPKPPPPLDTCT